MLKNIKLNNYVVYQGASFIVSLLATVLIIRGLGSDQYGHFSFYVATGEFIKTIMVLGFDQSISHFKEERLLDAKKHDSIIFSAKFILFIVITPFIFIINDKYVELALFGLIISGMFDVSYLHMEGSSLKQLGLVMFYTRALYLIIIVLLNYFHYPYQFYFVAFAIINIAYSFILIKLNNRLYFISINLKKGYELVKKAFVVGFGRVYLFTEALLILYIFRIALSADSFGYFMIIFNIAKLMSGFMGIAITPYYKKITNDNANKFQAYRYLTMIGFLIIGVAILFNYLLPVQYLKYLIKLEIEDDTFRLWLTCSLLYSLIIFYVSIYLNIGLIAYQKMRIFYVSRIIYMLLAAILVFSVLSNQPLLSIMILMFSELFILVGTILFKKILPFGLFLAASSIDE